MFRFLLLVVVVVGVPCFCRVVPLGGKFFWDEFEFDSDAQWLLFFLQTRAPLPSSLCHSSGRDLFQSSQMNMHSTHTDTRRPGEPRTDPFQVPIYINLTLIPHYSVWKLLVAAFACRTYPCDKLPLTVSYETNQLRTALDVSHDFFSPSVLKSPPTLLTCTHPRILCCCFCSYWYWSTGCYGKRGRVVTSPPDLFG